MKTTFLTSSLIHEQGDKARVIQTLLFVSGINTLLQALFGTRLPAVVGGSFAYVIPIAYIVGDSSLQRISDPHEVSHYLSLTKLLSLLIFIFLFLYVWELQRGEYFTTFN